MSGHERSTIDRAVQLYMADLQAQLWRVDALNYTHLSADCVSVINKKLRESTNAGAIRALSCGVPFRVEDRPDLHAVCII